VIVRRAFERDLLPYAAQRARSASENPNTSENFYEKSAFTRFTLIGMRKDWWLQLECVVGVEKEVGQRDESTMPVHSLGRRTPPERAIVR